MNHFDSYKTLLEEFIGFKSISTDPAYQEEIQNCVNWLRNIFIERGFSVEIWEMGESNPVVFAEYVVDEDKETILVYGHYDVQPAQQEDGWEIDPFTLNQMGDKLVARGVVDNKGQVLIHMATVFDLIERGELGYNVKFLIEGNEEMGGQELGDIIRDHYDDLQIDQVLISDGEIPYKPMIEASYRGVLNASVTLKTADNAVHSGLFGGPFPNAAHELSKLISFFFDENHRVQIEGFYEGIDEVSGKEMKNAQRLDDLRQHALEHTGVRGLLLEPGHTFSTQNAFLPMLTVTGIKAGYAGDGYSNSIPNLATAKINFRLPASQDPVVIYSHFESFVREHVSDHVEITTEMDEHTRGIKIDVTSFFHQNVIQMLRNVYDEEVYFNYCGATIPVIVDFKEIFGLDPVCVPLGNDDCNMHGVDENFDIELIKKGLAFSKELFQA